MKFRIAARYDNDPAIVALGGVGAVADLPDDTASFLRATERCGRFTLYWPGDKAAWSDPEMPVIRFENDYD